MIKLTKKQVLELHVALNSLGNLLGAKFTYAVARNKAKIKNEVESLQVAQKASPEFGAYEEKRIALAKKYAKKNEKGEFEYATGPNGQAFKIEDEEAFSKEFEQLRAEYKDVLDAREQQGKDFEKLLEEEVSVDLYMLPFSSVPENINANQMSGILPIIEEDK